MEQELRKCIFDESGTGMVYLQNIPSEDQVILSRIYFKYNIIIKL